MCAELDQTAEARPCVLLAEQREIEVTVLEQLASCRRDARNIAEGGKISQRVAQLLMAEACGSRCKKLCRFLGLQGGHAAGDAQATPSVDLSLFTVFVSAFALRAASSSAALALRAKPSQISAGRPFVPSVSETSPRATSRAGAPHCASLPITRNSVLVDNYASDAFKVIGVAASAFETGHCFLVSSAIESNFAFSIPGISAFVVSAIEEILKPSPSLSSCTAADV